MEYQCIECKHYIAYNMGNRVVYQGSLQFEYSKHELSVFGDRTKGKSEKSMSKQATICPECGEEMIILGRTLNTVKRGTAMDYMRSGYRDLCKNCDLVSTKYDHQSL